MINGNLAHWQPRAGECWFFMEYDNMADWDGYRLPWEKERMTRNEMEEKPRFYEKQAEEARQRKRLEDLIIAAKQNSNRTVRPTYTSTVIAPPPAEYLVTYIGGPKNGFQEILERKEHKDIQDSKNYRFAIQQEVAPETFIKDQIPPPMIFHADYMMVFIPFNQTPFTDMQCICAVFVQ